jgi:hypothetical protein
MTADQSTRWHALSEFDLQKYCESLDDDTREQAENEKLRRKQDRRGGALPHLRGLERSES